MPELDQCPQCGARLRPGERCGGCLLLGALTVDDASESVPAGGGGGTPELENFQVLERIGEGGTAEVFRALQLEPIEREVALKLIKPGMDSERVMARFEAERQVLARLQHANIATVLDAGKSATGRPYFALEHVDGVPLSEFADAGDLALKARLELFTKVCGAVHHAHQRGIVHRDLKPSNILVDASGEPKVIDFGIARALEEGLDAQTLFLTREGDFLGTPAYMSPEQARGEVAEIDTRTDVYSLGVLLYELLTGTLPVETADIRALAAGGETVIERPSRRDTTTTVNAGAMRGDIDWIVMRALETDKERRYDSAAAFGDDVWRYLRNEPVSAGPPTASYRLRKFAKRHRGAAAGIVVGALSLVVGTGVSIWQAGRAKLAAAKAEAAEQVALDEKETAQAVNDFLVDDLLGATDMEKSADPNIRVVELVDRAAEKVDERFAGKPKVAAPVNETIGNVYLALGSHEKAYDHLSRARLAYESLPADYDRRPHLRRVLRDLSTVRFRQRRIGEARALYEESMAVMDGDEVPEESRLSGAMYLASLVKEEGDLAGSLEILKELSEATAGRPESDELARQLDYNIGLSLTAAGSKAEAIPHFERFIAWLGEEPVADLADALTEMAKAKFAVGRPQEAEVDFLRAVEIQKVARKPGHPARLLTDEALASFYDDTGRLPLAVPIYERLLAEGVKPGEPPHAYTLMAMHNYAVALTGTDNERAAELLAGAISGRAELLGETHPSTAASRYSLAIVRWDEGDFDAAIALWKRVHEDLTHSVGASDPDTLNALRLLAKAEFLQGRPEGGLPYCEQLLATPAPEHEILQAGASEQREKVYILIAQQNYAPAVLLPVAKVAVDTHPGDLAAWRMLGRALFRTGGRPGVAALASAAGGAVATPEFLAWCESEGVAAPRQVISLTSRWRYKIPTPPGDGWRKAGFDDSAWLEGLPEFGYGDGDETTVLEFGDDPQDKPMSAAFRSSFVYDPAADGDLTVDMVCDDGAVVYIDGREMRRVRMPAGDVSPDMPALVPGAGYDETAAERFVLPAGAFPSGGSHAICVQVHQEQPGSSDLSFRLTATVGTLDLDAVWDKVAPEELGAFFGEGLAAVEWLRNR